MRNQDPLRTATYLQKAGHFLSGVKLMSGDSDYATAAALLAVHSAISLNDAIFASLTGSPCQAEDHSQAAVQLDKLCNRIKVTEKQGVQHLRRLLSRKSVIAYTSHVIDVVFAKDLQDKAERFHAWAYNTFKGVLRASEV